MIVFANPWLCDAQKLRHTGKNFVMPIFVDSSEFKQEFIGSFAIKEIYRRLKEEEDYATYNYGFKISRQGKIIPTYYEENQLTNQFFRKFNKYHWAVAYLKGCLNCKLVSYGMINLYVVPREKYVRILISVGDGKAGTILNITTVFDQKLEM